MNDGTPLNGDDDSHPPRDLAGSALTAGIAFHAVAQTGAVAVSLAGGRIGPAAAWAILSLAAAAGYMAWRMTRRHQAPELHAKKNTAPRIAYFLPAVAAGMYAVLWISALAQPDSSTDGNLYHIPTIHFWALEGRIHWIQRDVGGGLLDLMNGFPKGVEAFGFLLVAATGADAPANAVNLAFLPLGVFGLMSLARSLGAGSAAACLAGAAWVFLPVNICQSATTYVDSAFASCMIAFFALLIQVGRDLDNNRVGMAPALAAGGAMGLCVGAKSVGLLAIALGIASLGVKAVGARRRPDGRGAARRAMAALAVMLIVALAVGGYWPARNWAITGSPLFPVGLTLAGQELFPGPSTSETVDADGNTPHELLSLPPVVRPIAAWLQWPPQWPRTIIGHDARLGGLGYVWALGCLPAILLLLWRGERMLSPSARSRFLQLFLLVSIAFLLTPMNWWARLTLWVYALGLPSLAAVLQVGWNDASTSRRASRWATTLCAILLVEGAISGAWTASYAYPGGWRAFLSKPAGAFTGKGWRRSPAQLFPGMKDSLIEEILLSGEPIGLGPLTTRQPGGPGRARILGLLSIPIGGRDIQPLTRKLNAEDMERLVGQGIRFVLWDSAVATPTVLAGSAVRSENAAGFLGFELRPMQTPEKRD